MPHRGQETVIRGLRLGRWRAILRRTRPTRVYPYCARHVSRTYRLSVVCTPRYDACATKVRGAHAGPRTLDHPPSGCGIDPRFFRIAQASPAGRSTAAARPGAVLCCRGLHLPIGFQPSIDQRHYSIEGGVPHALLLRGKLNELVRALDIRGTVVQGAGGRGGTPQALRRRRVLFERHHFVTRGTNLDTYVEHEIVDGARRFQIRMNGLPDGPHPVLGYALVVPGHQHGPLGQGYEDRVIEPHLHRQLYPAVGGIE